MATIAALTIAGGATPSRALVLTAIVLAIPDLSRRHNYAPELWAGALALVLWASVIWSDSSALSEQISTDQIFVAGMFVAYRVAIADRRAMLLVGTGYLVGCLLLLRRLLDENTTASLSFQASESARYTIEGVNQNYIAFTLVGGIAAAILLAQTTRKGLPLLVAAAVLCWLGILLTDTRAAMIAGLAATAWWLLVPGRFRRLALGVLVAGVLVVAWGIVTGGADDELAALFAASSERDVGGLDNRLNFWPVARDAFYEQPILGHGAGSITLDLPNGVFAHNVFLDIGTSAGLLGIGVFLAALYAILFRASVDMRDPRRRRLLIGVALCAISAPLLAGYWYQAAPFWLLLALFSRMAVLDVARGDDSTRETGSELRLRHAASSTTFDRFR